MHNWARWGCVRVSGFMTWLVPAISISVPISSAYTQVDSVNTPILTYVSPHFVLWAGGAKFAPRIDLLHCCRQHYEPGSQTKSPRCECSASYQSPTSQQPAWKALTAQLMTTLDCGRSDLLSSNCRREAAPANVVRKVCQSILGRFLRHASGAYQAGAAVGFPTWPTWAMRIFGPARATSLTMPRKRSPSMIGDSGSSSASMTISRPLTSRT